MLGAALHLRDEDTQVTTRFWWQDGDTPTERPRSFAEPTRWEDEDADTVSHPSPAAQLSCSSPQSGSRKGNTPRLTRAQALYAVLWQGADARDVRGLL